MLLALLGLVGVALGVARAAVHLAADVVVAPVTSQFVIAGVLATAAATVKKIVDFVRFLSAKDVISVVTQVLAWVAGIGAAFLLAAADITANYDLGGGYVLGRANGASLILLGLGFGSGGSLLTDLIKARDNSQSAAVPRLGGGDQPSVAPGGDGEA
jgi:hypothetical protein